MTIYVSQGRYTAAAIKGMSVAPAVEINRGLLAVTFNNLQVIERWVTIPEVALSEAA
jgi:hypothetical protein